MSHAATDAQTHAKTDKTPLVLQKEANEWGQIDGLEAHAPYFVIRRPSVETGKEKSREFVEEVRAFLHEHKVLTEKQMKELNERYGEPAKARVGEVRATLEKRFDDISKELEGLVARLESEMADRGILRKKEDKAAAAAAASAPPAKDGKPGETPGEMPTGEHKAG